MKEQGLEVRKDSSVLVKFGNGVNASGDLHIDWNPLVLQRQARKQLHSAIIPPISLNMNFTLTLS
jgi:hypothetical protein